MALYETLIEGGHEHLIDAVKARIAQKADAIIEDELKPIIENQPSATLEGELLVAEDAADLPPVMVYVDGKSTQVTTTGKNLFNKEGPKGYWSDTDGSFVNSSLRVWWSVPVSEGDVIRSSATGVWRSQTYLDGVFVEGGIDTRPSSGYVIPSGVDEIRGSIANNGWDTGIVTKNNADLTYEPYTGGAPAPNPDYPQPIVSVDASSVTLAGKNLLSTDLIEQGAIATDQTDKSSQNRCRVAASYNLDALAGNAVTCSGTINGGTLQYALSGYDGGTRVSSNWINSGSSYSIPAGRKKNRILFRRSDDANIAPADFSNIQLEVGSTATAYEPYAGTTVPLYDGTLRSLPDDTKDTLSLSYLRPSTREGWAWYSAETTKQVAYETFDGTDITGWSIANGTYPFYQFIWGSKAGSGASDWTALTENNSRCSNCTYAPYISAGNNVIGYSNTNYAMRYRYQDMAGVDASLTDLAAFFADSPVTFMVPMQHPITTQLDPIELPVLPAPNCTVRADPTANLKLTYAIDSETIEESLESGIGKSFSSIAPVETSPATDNHDVGSRIVYNETLYKVTSAIAAGEDITPGTNVTPTTVAAELLATQA